MAYRNWSDFHNLAERQYVILSLSESEGLRHDIERFVSDSLGALLPTTYRGLSSATLQEVEDEVVEHVVGLFL